MYNTNLLNSTSDCDALLNLANTEQDDLMFRKEAIERRALSFANNAVAIEAELSATMAEYNAVVSIIAGLPDGKVKDDLIKDQKRLEYRTFLLSQRKKGSGTVAALDSALEVAKIDKALEAINTFITEVENRKSQL